MLLIPGFLAGDTSLAMLAGWLWRRGHAVRTAGMWFNLDCSERTVARLEQRAAEFAAEQRSPITVIGQSRGGLFARALTVRRPDIASHAVMLGSPVLDQLAVATSTERAIRAVANLGTLGLPGMLSFDCGDGECCASFRKDLLRPRPHGTTLTSIYSRSDAIIDWRTCLDPHAEQVEVNSSHCGMSVHIETYRVLAARLDAGSASAAA